MGGRFHAGEAERGNARRPQRGLMMPDGRRSTFLSYFEVLVGAAAFTSHHRARPVSLLLRRATRAIIAFLNPLHRLSSSTLGVLPTRFFASYDDLRYIVLSIIILSLRIPPTDAAAAAAASTIVTDAVLYYILLQ